MKTTCLQQADRDGEIQVLLILLNMLLAITFDTYGLLFFSPVAGLSGNRPLVALLLLKAGQLLRNVERVYVN